MFSESKSLKIERKTYRYRRFLSQFVATTVKNMLVADAGLCFSVSAIVIAALTGIRNEHNQNEALTITPAQASWLGALGFVTKPIGAVISGIAVDPLGRKRAMIVVNLFYACGWFTLYQSTEVWQVFFGIAFLGLSCGLTEAPVMAYLGEICEPSFRGVLIGYTYFCYSFGMFMIYLLNTLMAWRTVCLTCLTLPIITAISVFFVPETVQWYLSKNRTAEAEESLCWLRGWVTRDIVAQEFQDLQRHSERSKSCSTCIKQDIKCTHPLPTMREKFAELKRKQTLKPMFIITSLFLFAQYPGILSLKPYMVQIFKAYDSPIPADKAVTIMSLLDNLGNVSFMLLVRFTGKRRLYLFCMSVVLACLAIITWYGFTYLPSGYISFDQANREPFHLENQYLSYVPIVCLLIWSHCAFCCLNALPWMLLSELFSFKSRGIGNGITAAFFYISIFCTIKSYYNLEMALSLPGVSLVYTIITLFGLIFMYKILPETENRSLEDIELHFADNSKGITDWKIDISKHTAKGGNIHNCNTSKF